MDPHGTRNLPAGGTDGAISGAANQVNGTFDAARSRGQHFKNATAFAVHMEWQRKEIAGKGVTLDL